MRVVFEYLHNVGTARDEWFALRDWIATQGARLVEEPKGPPPYTLTAILTLDSDPAKFLTGIQKRGGVGRAELEQWRSIS